MEDYKTSVYTTIQKTDYGMMLFNTFSCGLLKITNEEVMALKSHNMETISLLAEKYPHYRTVLINNGFLVRKNVDEFALVKSRLYKYKYNADNASITINTGLACNCRCVYCYEGQEHDNRSILTHEKASDSVVFIKKQYSATTRLHLAFLGGEPLICFEQIKHIYSELKNSFGHVSLQLTTNGVLVNDEVAKFLREIKDVNIQVSIDGLKHHHDSKRIGSDGEGTYDRIITNVKILQDESVPISIRVHIDQEFMNNVNIKKWTDTIKTDFDLDKPISFFVIPILIPGKGTEIADKAFIDRMVFIYEAFIDSQIPFGIDSIFRPASFCFVALENCLSIDCNGEIYKCWNDLTADNFNGRHFGNISRQTHEYFVLRFFAVFGLFSMKKWPVKQYF